MTKIKEFDTIVKRTKTSFYENYPEYTDFKKEVDPTFVQMSKGHSQFGGYHNSQKFYDEYVLNMITAELSKHNTNRRRKEYE